MDTALRICLLSKNAQVPVRATPGSAGYDLFSAVDTVIEAHDKACISTDVQLAIPSGMYGRIAPRSSLAWKHHINVGAGYTTL